MEVQSSVFYHLKRKKDRADIDGYYKQKKSLHQKSHFYASFLIF